MKMMSNSANPLIEKLIRYRWWIIGPVGLFFIVAEFKEDFLIRMDFLNTLELCFLLLLLVVTGFLLELLFRTMRNQDRSMAIISFQHKIGLELMTHEDWFGLTEKLARIPAEIAPIQESCLFVFNAKTGHYEAVGRWRDESKVPPRMRIDEVCENCRMQGTIMGTCTNCSGSLIPGAVEHDLPNCIPLIYGKNQIAMIRYALKPGENLSANQQVILKQISDDLAIALKAGQDRRQLAEIRQSEASRAERRRVSHFLHDHLSQNLGFLRLKLDQLVTENRETAPNVVKNDLILMLSVANESFDLVHGTLEVINPDVKSNLTQLLEEHTTQTAERFCLEMNFRVEGTPQPVVQEVQREISYVFREAVNNITRHSWATKVDIVLRWTASVVQMEISDNGIGFDPQSVDPLKHFGLGIMDEHIASLGGTFDIHTEANCGTVISFCVPLNPQFRELVPERQDDHANLNS